MPQPRRPRPKISLWARFRHSPLKLRRSCSQLSSPDTNGFFALIRLLIPYPSWHFAIAGPYSPRELIDDEKRETGIISSQFGDLRNLQAIPLWRMRDTPLRSIYRIYDLHLADQYGFMGYETEYFFFHSDWRLRDIPDPKDPDPVRYAVVACIVEELQESLNWKLSLGLRRHGEQIIRERNEDPYPEFVPEELPAWTKNVPAIDKELLKQSVPSHMLSTEGQLVLEAKGLSLIFAQRNIVTNTGWFYTI
ncbi:uncharacterized protein N7483_005263 [Penicillium malachiteum]|uniref:uncharacterized protein n=1 Tax=Penicillium malachiteum TaxID=1324776 RepID=UPI0025491597|nr:uncharacterized protein N7483_005263 [Penicillium malachiteum]KAJ5730755.1 hypothetical protein N7483_005263 [Penicillium malachiteum]